NLIRVRFYSLLSRLCGEFAHGYRALLALSGRCCWHVLCLDLVLEGGDPLLHDASSFGVLLFELLQLLFQLRRILGFGHSHQAKQPRRVVRNAYHALTSVCRATMERGPA